MTNTRFQPGKFLIILSIFLFYAIYLVSPKIAYSIDSIEESNLMQRAYEFLNEGEPEYALHFYDYFLCLNPTDI